MAILSITEKSTGEVVARHTVFKRVTTLGSAPDCDIVINGPDVESLHAMLVLEGATFLLNRGPDVRHLEINGHRKRKAILQHGDFITMGHLLVKFDLFGERSDNEIDGARQSVLLEAYERLHGFSEHLAAAKGVSDLLERLLDDVMELVDAEKGFIFLAEGGAAQTLCARNIHADQVSTLERDAWSDTIVQEVMDTREPVIVSDAMHEPQFESSMSVMNLQIASVLCVPLIYRDTLLGVLYLGNKNVVSLFDEDTLSLVYVFAAQASLLIHGAVALDELTADRDRLKAEIKEIRFGEIIGASECMLQVFHTIDRVAGTSLPVLIEGETGTGKELVAHELHRRGPQMDGAFVAVNCGAIPDNLLESELFGHVRGAFSGAVSDHRGFFQRAHKGTLFLDEVGEIPLNLQVKLLRALQEQVIRPVGSERDISVELRVIAATNRNTEQEVAAGSFREDLYYRLNGITLRLPPLRDRGEDVLLIARALLSIYQVELNPSVRGFDEGALNALMTHTWSGNVRELENRIKKALIMADGSRISAIDLELQESDENPILPLSEAKEQFTRQYIEGVLTRNQGNRAKTAADLHVDPRTIYRYLEAKEKEE